MSTLEGDRRSLCQPARFGRESSARNSARKAARALLCLCFGAAGISIVTARESRHCLHSARTEWSGYIEYSSDKDVKGTLKRFAFSLPSQLLNVSEQEVAILSKIKPRLCVSKHTRKGSLAGTVMVKRRGLKCQWLSHGLPCYNKPVLNRLN